MGFLDSIFGRKKKDSIKPEGRVDRDSCSDSLVVVSAENKSELQKYADKGHPVLISGGDFNGQKVIIVSRPSKTPRLSFQGISYPVVTIDRLSLGTYEGVSFIGNPSEEEVKRQRDLEKKRKGDAEREKADFMANRFKEGYEAHRYQRPVAETTKQEAEPKPKPEPKPEPKRNIDEIIANLPVYRIDEEGNEIPIEKPKSAPKPAYESPWMTADEKAQELAQKESKRTQIKEVHFDDMVPEEDTYCYRLDQLTVALPEFDFYTGDNDKEVTDDHPSVIAIKTIQKEVDEIMAQGEMAIKEKDWTTAARCYEQLVIKRYWDPQPYTKLMAIYSKERQPATVQRQMRSLTRHFFHDRREKMEKELLRLAAKYDSTIYAEKCINNGESVAYYDGLYDIYNPCPIIEETLYGI